MVSWGLVAMAMALVSGPASFYAMRFLLGVAEADFFPGMPLAVIIVALTFAAVGIYAAISTFWSLPTTILTGPGAAAGIALVNSVGNLGGLVGPSIVGVIRQARAASPRPCSSSPRWSRSAASSRSCSATPSGRVEPGFVPYIVPRLAKPSVLRSVAYRPNSACRNPAPAQLQARARDRECRNHR